MPSVTLFRDFREDARTSMDVYADCVRDALASDPELSFRVREYTPRLPAGVRQPSPWRMRYARYIGYPMQARGQRGDVNHIVDHGYAHLLYVLDRARTVITIHDLIPILAWRGVIANHGVSHRPLLAEYALAAAKKAARVIAVSSNTKNDLVEQLGFNAARISVIPNGLSPQFKILDDEARRRAHESFGFPAHAKVVLITGWQHYKNHAACAEAFAALYRSTRDENLRLVRLGRRTPEWQEMKERHGITDRTADIEWLPEWQLVELYNVSSVLLFPSIYEGFGWPPLQAMACGVPVVCSSAGALLEVVGDAAITTSSADIPAMVDGLTRLLNDDAQRRDYIARGRKRAAAFSWTQNAAALRGIYQDLAGAM